MQRTERKNPKPGWSEERLTMPKRAGSGICFGASTSDIPRISYPRCRLDMSLPFCL